jgi:2-alkyl-3-oxoalkanoate reductase
MVVLVTGGGGFLGGAIVQRCLQRGYQVRSLARGAYPQLAAQGVEVLRGDVADPEVTGRAVQGCDAVFHVAAKAGAWGDYSDYEQANVKGTQAVIDACRQHGVPRLVHTSSPSVVISGQDIEGGDESMPFPAEFHSHYSATKAIAEKLVLAADSPSLSTVALRPHLIWGPGDNQVIPRVVDRARKGRLALVDGGRKKIDCTYIDNAAEAHMMAFDRLAPGAACAGKAYFITNGEPVVLREMINDVLRIAGLPPCEREVSLGAARFIGGICELAWKILPLEGEPPLTRWLADELGTAHWFRIDRARQDFGFVPQVSMAEGMRRLEKAWQEGRA